MHIRMGMMPIWLCRHGELRTCLFIPYGRLEQELGWVGTTLIYTICESVPQIYKHSYAFVAVCACLGACMQIWTEHACGSTRLPSDLSGNVYNIAFKGKSKYMCMEHAFMRVHEKCFLCFNASNGNLFSLPQQNPHSNPLKAVIFGMCHKYA